jgi:hypothetical protein
MAISAPKTQRLAAEVLIGVLPLSMHVHQFHLRTILLSYFNNAGRKNKGSRKVAVE